MERKTVESTAEWNVAPGLFVISFAGVVFFLAQALLTSPDIVPSVKIGSLVLSWIGAFILCFGRKAAWSELFPLLFLFWLVPIPSVALAKIVHYLQVGSAETAWLIFSTVGVPISRDGVLLSIPGLNIEVARECSSIRSSLMLLVTTMVLAQLFLRSPLRKLLVIGLAVPLSVAKNGLRIFVIAMLGTRVDPGFLTGKLHHNGGIVFFAVALAVIFLFLWILMRTEDGSGSASKQAVRFVSSSS